MKAPDRIWLVDLSLWTNEPTDAPNSEEYIRKGAFPVEEIAQACHSSWLAEDLEDLLSRILSLLESDDE